jgi:hypothetical protein
MTGWAGSFIIFQVFYRKKYKNSNWRISCPERGICTKHPSKKNRILKLSKPGPSASAELTLPLQNWRWFRICTKFSFDAVKRKGGRRIGIAGGKRKSFLSAYAEDHACVQKRWTLRRAGTGFARGAPSNDIDNNENQCNMMALFQDLSPGVQETGLSVLNAIKRGKSNDFGN